MQAACCKIWKCYHDSKCGSHDVVPEFVLAWSSHVSPWGYQFFDFRVVHLGAYERMWTRAIHVLKHQDIGLVMRPFCGNF